MKIYLAGVKSKRERQMVNDIGYNQLLFSYYLHQNIFEKHSDFLTNKDIILDSGAYSAFNSGIEIKIEEYVNFIKKHNIEKYINLDVIDDPISSIMNLRYMESEGLSPIPVYHYNTNDPDLLKYYSDNYSYVCIGGTVPIRNKKLIAENIKKLIIEYEINTKIHLLGYTSFDGMFLLKDLIYSTDSATWVIASSFGEIIQSNGKRKKVSHIMDRKNRDSTNMKNFQFIEECINKGVEFWKL